MIDLELKKYKFNTLLLRLEIRQNALNHMLRYQSGLSSDLLGDPFSAKYVSMSKYGFYRKFFNVGMEKLKKEIK